MARKPTLPGWAGRPATDGAKRVSPRGASSETILGPLDPASVRVSTGFRISGYPNERRRGKKERSMSHRHRT
jgi:hypothetical protein